MMSLSAACRLSSRSIIISRCTFATPAARGKGYINRILLHRPKSSTSTSTTKSNNTQRTIKEYLNEPRNIFDGRLSLAQILCGRLSFVLSLCAFMETDIFNLRALAMGSSFLSMSFQNIARPGPQKYPLYWGIALLAVNSYMFGHLWCERNEASEMGDELEDVFEKYDFVRQGFSRVEFYKLFRLGGKCQARKRRLEEGEILIVQNKTNMRLHFILEGSAIVRLQLPGNNGHKYLVTIKDGAFVGELSMLDALNTQNLSVDPAATEVVIGKGGATVVEWDIINLRNFMWENRDVSNALQTFVCHDLRDKLRRSNDEMICRTRSTKRYSKPDTDPKENRRWLRRSWVKIWSDNSNIAPPIDINDDELLVPIIRT
jgi:CRP-like cAMP-binding protein